MIQKIQRWHITLPHPSKFNFFLKISVKLLDNIAYIAGYSSEFTHSEYYYDFSIVKVNASLLDAYEQGLKESYSTILSYKLNEHFLESK